VTTGQVGLRVGVVCGTAGEQPKVTVQDVEDEEEEEVDEGGDRDPTDSDFMAKGALKRAHTHTHTRHTTRARHSLTHPLFLM
jgi:hypothetical protein